MPPTGSSGETLDFGQGRETDGHSARISEMRSPTNARDVVLEAITKPRPVGRCGPVRNDVPASADTQVRKPLVKAEVSTPDGSTRVKPRGPSSDNPGSGRNKGIASSKSTSQLVNEGLVRKLANHSPGVRNRSASFSWKLGRGKASSSSSSCWHRRVNGHPGRRLICS